MISVVIPMYNSMDTVCDSIDSVLNQTKAGLIEEIIVVDDGSVDPGYEYVRERYRNEPLVKCRRKRNGGVSTARNYGIRMAKGEWIALLDSDDRWLQKKIEKQADVLARHPEIKFLGTGRNKEKLTWGRKVEEGLYYLDLWHQLIKAWPHPSTVLIHRSVIDSVGLFDETRRYAEDGEYWDRVALRYHLYYLSEPLEIAGDFKSPFGERGLSANLKEMQEGNMLNIRILHEQKNISTVFYLFLVLLYKVKYFRRIMITKIMH